MFCQGGPGAVAAFAGFFWPTHGCEGRVQCLDAFTGPALSGRSVCGAAQGGTASGRKRRFKITMALQQAQCASAVVVQKAEVSGPLKAFGQDVLQQQPQKVRAG